LENEKERVDHYQRFSNYQAGIGESPVYDQRNHTLYWVDINGKRILYKSLVTQKDQMVDCPDVISSIQLTGRPGRLIGTLRHEFSEVNLETRKFTRLGEQVEGNVPNNRFNDGKCDYSGRYWAGTMNLDLSSPTAALYLLGLDKSVKKVLDGLSISNGIAWSLDNSKMYLIDTPLLKVFQFDFDSATGEIRNRKACVDFASEKGRPDGMTIDSQGMLWIAHARGGRVSSWDPEKGKKLLEFEFPVKATTSLTFGGQDYRTLFVTTARDLLNESDAGYTYTFQPGAKGLAPNICRL
jgi:sugar lactone lactonase YvrE